MKLPIVTRSHHEEVTGLLRERVVALEKELYRLKDHIFQKAFGVQLHDTLPVEAAAEVQTSAPATPQPEPEVDITSDEREKMADERRLAAIARTRPSQMGNAMTAVMQRRAMKMARSTFPTHTVAGQEPHPAKKLFDEAKREVLA